MTLEEVRDALGATEPDYPLIAREFGAAAIPFLRQLVVSDDRRIAAKAVYLAAMLNDTWSVQTAATQASEYTRVAAAGAAPDLEPSEAVTILDKLWDDPDATVRGVAERIVANNPGIGRLFPRR